MGHSKIYNQHTYSYLALRKTIGWIGILLPFVLVLGMFFLFQGDILQKSISHYYHTGMQDIFVGAICTIALFMFFYSGYDKWDNITGNISGIMALGVAWFPTTKSGLSVWQGYIHFICAALFFTSLAIFSMFLFTKKGKGQQTTKEKLKRNLVYRICGLIMIFSLVSIILFYRFFYTVESSSIFVLIAETIALLAFGFSWLVKGGALYADIFIKEIEQKS